MQVVPLVVSELVRSVFLALETVSKIYSVDDPSPFFRHPPFGGCDDGRKAMDSVIASPKPEIQRTEGLGTLPFKCILTLRTSMHLPTTLNSRKRKQITKVHPNRRVEDGGRFPDIAFATGGGKHQSWV